MAETDPPTRVLLPFARPGSLPSVRTHQPDVADNGTLCWDDAEDAFNRDLDGAGRRRCYTTGVGPLDAAVCGLMQGNVVLVAGRTGSGKSSLAMTTMLTLVGAGALPVLYVSLEMPARDMAIRSLAWLTGISQTRLLAADVGRVVLEDDERQALSIANGAIRGRRWIMAGSFTMAQVRAEARRVQAAHGLAAVILDHAGLVTPEAGRRGDAREREVAAASRGFKQLMMELNVAGMLLAQLNRGADRDREPELWHLRESGGLEQDAAAVAFLWPAASDACDMKRVFVRKNRFGPLADFEVPWDGACGRIGEWARGDDAAE